MSNKTTCKICDSVYRTIDVKRHCSTAKHIKAMNEGESPIKSIKDIFEETINMDNPFEGLKNPEKYDDVTQNENANFNALSNNTDVDTKEQSKKSIEEDKDVIIDKINKMIVLFDSDFGHEPKATSSDTLNTVKTRLKQMESTVNSSCVNNFISDAVTSTLLMIEPISANSSYNISGLSALLKTNKDFIRQCKLLSIKYGGFSNMPVEIQLVFTISMTAYIVVGKNRNSGVIKDILNEPYIPKITTKIPEKLPDTITLKL